MFLLGTGFGLALSYLPPASLRKVIDIAGEVGKELAKMIVCQQCGYVGTNPEEHQQRHTAFSKGLQPGPVPINDKVEGR